MQTETIADRIRQIRRELGNPSQQDFGKPLGVTKSAVGQWESGKTELSADTLFKIELVYKYRAKWIQTGEPPKQVEGNSPAIYESSNVAPGPPNADLAPKERALLDTFRGLTPEQQDEYQHNLEETRRKNLEIFKALKNQIKDECSGKE